MSITTVIPPTSTPAGWFGCFGPPLNVDVGIPTAWPVSGQSPCGNGVVESCCLFGDQCLSNGVCQILPVAGGGRNVSYYGAYCTDPTFTSPQCTSNCAVEYMAYCGSNNIWQCRNTDRDHPLSCNLADSTKKGSSTFFMIEPSKLAKGSMLPSTGPSTTQVQYIPTQWGVPKAPLSTASPSFTTLPGSATASTLTVSPTINNAPSTSPSSSSSSIPTSSDGGLSQSDKLQIGLGVGLGVPSLIATYYGAYWTYRTFIKP